MSKWRDMYGTQLLRLCNWMDGYQVYNRYRKYWPAFHHNCISRKFWLVTNPNFKSPNNRQCFVNYAIISCTECKQMIKKFGRDSSKAPSLHAFVLFVQLSFIRRQYIAIIILNLHINQSINQSIKPKEGTVQRDNKEHSRNMHTHKNTIKSTSTGYSSWSGRIKGDRGIDAYSTSQLRCLCQASLGYYSIYSASL